MKTVWTSGGILLVATLIAVLGARAIFATALNAHTFTSTHLTMMSLFAAIPLISWGRKIQLSDDTLSYKWYVAQDEILLPQIERAEVGQQGMTYDLEIYRATCRDAHHPLQSRRFPSRLHQKFSPRTPNAEPAD